VLDAWTHAREQITKEMMAELEQEIAEDGDLDAEIIETEAGEGGEESELSEEEGETGEEEEVPLGADPQQLGLTGDRNLPDARLVGQGHLRNDDAHSLGRFPGGHTLATRPAAPHLPALDEIVGQ